MTRIHLRAVAVAAATIGALLSAGNVPAVAGNCSVLGCGVVKNNSGFPLLIADWCGSDACGVIKAVMPGENSKKYQADVDVFLLQCYGVYVLENSGITRSVNGNRWERIHDGQTADVRYQAC